MKSITDNSSGNYTITPRIPFKVSPSWVAFCGPSSAMHHGLAVSGQYGDNYRKGIVVKTFGLSGTSISTNQDSVSISVVAFGELENE